MSLWNLYTYVLVTREIIRRTARFCMRDGFYEWVQHTERRSTESLRPVHSLVMQISRLRMHLLARQISQIPGFRPQWLCQAKTDCWRIVCPKNKLAAVK